LKRDEILGIILIAAGALLFLARYAFNINIIGFTAEDLWPLFVLVPGVVFELAYIESGKNPGLLVPGGILTTIGLLFFFETATNWHFSEYTWPIYPLAVAIGLFQLYSVIRQRALLIPVLILALVSFSSLAILLFGAIFSWVNFTVILAAAFILLGVRMIFRDR
jgi:hypothetical protein